MLVNKNLNKLLSAVLVAGGVSAAIPSYAANQAMTDLIKILHDKGSLTTEEYQLLVKAANADDQHAAEANRVIEEQVADVAKASKASSWTDSIRLKGDIRLRYQDQSQDGKVDRDRGRLRYRLGVAAKPNDGLEVGAGLASGGPDPRSTNQSFDSSFTSKGINLDYAYAKYKINDNLTAIGGKFKRKAYLWAPTDLMWDGDINPEGVSVNYTRSSDLGTSFANAGLWVLEENSGSKEDPKLAYLQIGQKFGADNLFGTVAGTYYDFSEINALDDLTGLPSTNTDFQFDAISVSAEVGLKNALGEGSKVSLISDWVHNVDTDTAEDTGYSIGLKASLGAWSAKYIYADLETNAVPDIFPDSDRFSGRTGIDGHEIASNQCWSDFDNISNPNFQHTSLS